MKPFLEKKLQSILKTLARWTILRYRPGIIGVTGNVGKTSAKEAIKAVLGRERKVRSASKNFNNEIGLPLAILGDWRETDGIIFWARVIAFSFLRLLINLPEYPELLILEYGIDRPGDMKRLLQVARPQVGVLTPTGEIPAHIEFFSGKEAVLREKLRLIQSLPVTGFAIINIDEGGAKKAAAETRAHVIKFGFSPNADLRIISRESHLHKGAAQTTFKLSYGGSVVPVKLEGVVGESQILASAAAAAVGIAFGLNLVKISEALVAYTPPPGRMKAIPGLKETVIIDDTYNSSPLAAESALDAIKELEAKRKIAVLGDMLELGKYTIDAHEEIGRIAAKTVHKLITTGTRAKFIAEAAQNAGMPKEKIASFNKLDDAASFLQNALEEGDLILIKGSQGVRMEKIVKALMRDPGKAKELLVRQTKKWLNTPGLYD